MFDMWEGKVVSVILAGLTQGAEVTPDWCNEPWDIETGTKQAVKTVKQAGS